MMKKRIMGILLTISLAATGIAGCTTSGASAPTTQPTTMVVPKRPMLATTVLETSIPETTAAILPIHTETTTVPTTAKVVSSVNSDRDVLPVIEHTAPSTVPVTTEPMVPMFEDVTSPTLATSATVPTIVAPTLPTEKTANNWGVVSTSTDVETSTGNIPVERGSYILIISEDEFSYIISWYGSTAEITKEFVRVIGQVSLAEETVFLQRKTVGVITP